LWEAPLFSDLMMALITITATATKMISIVKPTAPTSGIILGRSMTPGVDLAKLPRTWLKRPLGGGGDAA
jgi:hypothetical protein